MKQKSRIPKSFYDKRDLPTPRSEWWPEDAGELREAVIEGDTPRVLVGDGQHLRPAAIGERTFEVIRTERCNRILSVDRDSTIVRVESGARWGEFQAELTERGLSLERYQLLPSSATLGGLLSRHTAVHREMWGGELRSGVVALSTCSPGTDYRYIPAPRKASGPDLRWLYLGNEGLLGAILDVSLVTWRPMEGRAYVLPIEDFGDAAQLVADMWDGGVNPSWIHYTSYKSSPDELVVAVHGPGRMVEATTAFLSSRRSSFEVLAGEEVAQMRQKLEGSHPDRRSLATASRTIAATYSTADAVESLAALPDFVENVTITHWTRHHVHGFVRFEADRTVTDFPADLSRRALSARLVADDEPMRWPHASQTLKQALDPDRRLAIGP